VIRHLPPDELKRLDADVVRALETGDVNHLDILGYGEISCVVSWPAGDGELLACKRLPVFGHDDRYRSYAACFDQYLAALDAAGVRVQPSTLQAQSGGDGMVTAYCIQPRVAVGMMAPDLLRAAGLDEAVELFDRIVDVIVRCVRPTLGLDGQLSNWAIDDGELRYLDVTTPMMRDDHGVERLDVDLFLAALPPPLRWPVKVTMLPSILGHYYDPRAVVLDLLGNLIKERLAGPLPTLLERANRRDLDPPLTLEEVEGYYRDDARTWALLLALRRADRWVQRHVLGRTYPFLLPGRIERHV
jgi:hypothetical protein